MLCFKRGDILTADVEVLVNPVNCVGVMGRGLAKAFKDAYPANYQAYADACRKHEVSLGRMHVFNMNSTGNPRYIINFPTKGHWRERSAIHHIEAGLLDLVDKVRDLGVGSMALPRLGCGLGGLIWADVKPLVERIMGSLGMVEIVVYEPLETE